jgi:hypothetical protein
VAQCCKQNKTLAALHGLELETLLFRAGRHVEDWAYASTHDASLCNVNDIMGLPFERHFIAEDTLIPNELCFLSLKQ